MILGCLFPRLVFNKYLNKKVQVPCGRCAACRALKANEWSMRLEMESKCHKYVYFGTLTYHPDFRPTIDVSQLGYVSDTFEKSCSDSQAFLSYHNNKIPVCDSKDFSAFMKRLRQNLSLKKYGIPEEERRIRFFCTSEYGPTTFVCHFHYLLFFDSRTVAKNLKECVYKAWKCKNPYHSFSSFFRRNRLEPVRTSAAEYCANYIVANCKLPPILFEHPFRSKHTQSQSPSIGYSYISSTQMEKLSSRACDKISFKHPRTHKLLSFSMWRSLESRLFPKCMGFDRLSTRDRVTMYFFPATVAHSAKEFIIKFFSKWNSVAGYYYTFKKVLIFGKELLFPYSEIKEALKRCWYLSKRAIMEVYKRKCSYFSYVRSIEDYFRQKDYNNLKRQIEFQVELSNQPASSCSSLKYYPCLIDSGFFRNEREIEVSHYDSICATFGINSSHDDFNHERSFQFLRSFDIFNMIVIDNTKVRKKKDYVAKHPEFGRMYTTTLFNLVI